MEIGQRIAELRIKNGWTQDELAKKMGYTSRSTINKIELGHVDISQTKVKKFADVFGTTASALIGEVQENTDIFSPLQDILRVLMDDEIEVSYAGKVVDKNTRQLMITALDNVSVIAKYSL